MKTDLKHELKIGSEGFTSTGSLVTVIGLLAVGGANPLQVHVRLNGANPITYIVAEDGTLITDANGLQISPKDLSVTWLRETSIELSIEAHAVYRTMGGKNVLILHNPSDSVEWPFIAYTTKGNGESVSWLVDSFGRTLLEMDCLDKRLTGPNFIVTEQVAANFKAPYDNGISQFSAAVDGFTTLREISSANGEVDRQVRIRFSTTVSGYERLAAVLHLAYDQAAVGKGAERHGGMGVAFHDQPMQQINRMLGSVDGFIFQAHKKSLESTRMAYEPAVRELLGAINYLAGAVIYIQDRMNEGGE